MKRGQLVQGVVLSVDKKRGAVSVKSGQKVVAGSMVSLLNFSNQLQIFSVADSFFLHFKCSFVCRLDFSLRHMPKVAVAVV